MQQKKILKSVGNYGINKEIFFFRSLNILNKKKEIKNFSVDLDKKKYPDYVEDFFKLIKKNKIINISGIPNFILKDQDFKNFLYQLDPKTKDNYLMENFSYWLTKYAREKTKILTHYFLDENPNLSLVCMEFIHFCFEKKIYLDAKKTLESFDRHNKISDEAIKLELIKFEPKREINILGFGLDDGSYEQSIAFFLKKENLTKRVNIYGIDPYASRSKNVFYLTDQQLIDSRLKFDLVIARWVLHHVELKQRWKNFIECINRCNSGASVLIVEHGFLKKNHKLSEKKLYYLLNALFDIIANIGLRPRYFIGDSEKLGENFFISYLTPEDFSEISKKVNLSFTQELYEIGPEFPNQTINCMRIEKN